MLPPLPSDTVLDHSITAPLSAASWNRAVAALDKFYQWAHDEGYVQVLPFTYREATRMNRHHSATVQQNTALERAAHHHDVKFLTMDAYVFFRDVGLRGHLPNGTRISPSVDATESATPRSPSCLLQPVCGLPKPIASSIQNCQNLRESRTKEPSFLLASSTAKGEKSRKVYIPTRILRQITSYCEIERTNAIACGKLRRAYEQLAPSTACPIRISSDMESTGRRGNDICSCLPTCAPCTQFSPALSR